MRSNTWHCPYCGGGIVGGYDAEQMHERNCVMRPALPYQPECLCQWIATVGDYETEKCPIHDKPIPTR